MLNSTVDAVLQCLYTYARSRPIILSSKNPDVCMMLSLKQPHYPVFFSTSAGVSQHSDMLKFLAVFSKKTASLAMCNNLITILKHVLRSRSNRLQLMELHYMA